MVRAERMHRDTTRAERIDDMGGIGRVRREAAEMLDNEEVEVPGAGIGEESREPGPPERRGRPGIFVLADERRARTPCHRRDEAAVATGKLGPITARRNAGVGGNAHGRWRWHRCAHFAPTLVRTRRAPAAPFAARPRPLLFGARFASLGVAVCASTVLGAPSAKR